MATPALLVFAAASINWFYPPISYESGAPLRILSCFWAGVAIGRCLRLIYPEK